MQVAVDTTPPPSTATKTRLSGNQLFSARVIWLGLTLLSTTLFVIGLPTFFDDMNRICEGASCLPYASVTADGAAALEQLGLSLTFWSTFVIIMTSVVGLVFVAAGAAIFWRRSDDWMALVVSLSLALAPNWMLTQAHSLLSAYPGLHLPLVLVQVAGLASLSVLFYLFPNGRFVPQWTRWLVAVWIGLTLVFTLADALSGSYQDLIMAVFLGVGVLAQVYRYRNVSGPVERQQTKWVIFGFSGFVLALFAVAVPPMLFPTVLSPGDAPVSKAADVIMRLSILLPFALPAILFLPLSIAISALRYRLWDVDPILNRGLVYGVVTMLAVLVLFVMTLLVQVVVGEQQPLVALLLAGILSASTFNPVRNRVQHLVDRRIYGFRFDLNELHAMHHRPQVENPGALTGVVLNGYEVRGVIGQGGMGEIYQGSGEDGTVAIKTMLPSIAADTEMRTRFQREVEAGQRLDHPNIARVYVSGTHNNTPYLIMEYIDGHTIGELLKRDGKFNETDARRILQDIASALETAHQAGLVHRDLKPSNVMLRPDGTAVLMDFGVTKVSDASVALTGTGAVGTITYMAPEQIRSSREVDHRADIYALGVMLYEMIVGEPPFKGNPAQMVFAHLQQPPPDPRDAQPDMPRPVSKAILRALAKDPDDRFQSAHDFATALRA